MNCLLCIALVNWLVGCYCCLLLNKNKTWKWTTVSSNYYYQINILFILTSIINVKKEKLYNFKINKPGWLRICPCFVLDFNIFHKWRWYWEKTRCQTLFGNCTPSFMRLPSTLTWFPRYFYTHFPYAPALYHSQYSHISLLSLRLSIQLSMYLTIYLSIFSLAACLIVCASFCMYYPSSSPFISLFNTWTWVESYWVVLSLPVHDVLPDKLEGPHFAPIVMTMITLDVFACLNNMNAIFVPHQIWLSRRLNQMSTEEIIVHSLACKMLKNNDALYAMSIYTISSKQKLEFWEWRK